MELDLTPGRERVVVDGVDIGAACTSLTLHAAADGAPTLTIHLALFRTTVAGHATIQVPDQVRDTLIHLGWTPPGEATGG